MCATIEIYSQDIRECAYKVTSQELSEKILTHEYPLNYRGFRNSSYMEAF